MAKVKNISGQDLHVPELGWAVVPAGETVEIPDDRLKAFTCQGATWEQAKAGKAADTEVKG